MKVLHSELEYRLGGIESFLINLSRASINENVQFDFLMRGNNDIIESKIHSFGGKIYKVPSHRIKYVIFVLNLIINEKYDVIHIHKNSAADLLFPIIAKLASSSKIIIHSHNTQPSTSSKMRIFLHKMNRPLLNKIADVKLACSDKAADWLFGKEVNRREKIPIILNGVFIEDFKYSEAIRNEIRANIGVSTNDFLIGHVGVFRAQKNHRFLIEMLSKINDSHVKLLLVGDGALKKEIMEKAKILGVFDRVIFYGQSDQVNRLLQAMDIFMMPSLYEGLSVSCVEAQASGLPVVLSDTVSEMSKISDDVVMLPIDEVSPWVNEVQSCINKRRRNDNTYSIRKSGFDMYNTARVIADFYKA
jgi:glycosyltransferase involved in cell wall biosynthesis